MPPSQAPLLQYRQRAYETELLPLMSYLRNGAADVREVVLGESVDATWEAVQVACDVPPLAV